MKPVNEQLAEMQKKTLESLEPMQNMNVVAAEAFEKIARKNYDLMGDLVDYAVTQVKMPQPDADIKDVFEQRIAETQAFAERVNERAAEYVALASELGELAQAKVVTPVSEAMSEVVSEAAAEKPPVAKKKAAAKKTASKKAAAKK